MNKGKILIVEDNQLNLKLFQDILVINNFEVIAIADGFKAMEQIDLHMPDLILMDIQLHGISGLDIIKQIKQRDDLKHIPVIAITAFAMSYDEQNILSYGCDSYIAKPVMIADFLNKINEYFKVKEGK
ncbi:MAG: response regulator [Sphingobacteriia bacterium]|nr:response regulator [Sphingobacteriia bacterium]